MMHDTRRERTACLALVNHVQKEEEMDYQSNEIGELAAALAAAQATFTFAAKDSTAAMGSAGKRKYADLQSVLEAVREGLTANGLAVVQAPMPADNGIKLRTTLAHKSGQWMASELCLPQDRMGGVQGMGSALTYARRYALAAMVGIAQDDDDGETAMQESRKAENQRIQQTRRQAEENNPELPSKEMFAALMAYLSKRHGNDRDAYLNELSSFFGRPITSSRELTRSDVSEFLNAVNWH